MDDAWSDAQLKSYNPEIHKEEIYTSQVKQLYALALFGIVATILNSLILFIILAGVMPKTLLSIWLAATMIIAFLRVYLVVLFRKTKIEVADAHSWGNRFIAGLALSGVAWGSVGLLPFSESVTLAHQVFIAFVLGGMAAGAAATFSVSKEGYLAYSVPAMLPLTMRFFLFDDVFHYAMGSMLFLYGLLLWRISRRHYLVNTASMLLRFENKDIIDQLRQAKGDMEKLNDDLLIQIDAKLKVEAELRAYHDHLESVIQERTQELRRSEARALEQSAALNALIDAMPAGVLISHDPDCVKITGNPTGMEIIRAAQELDVSRTAPNERRSLFEMRMGGTLISIEQLPIYVACVTGRPVLGEEIEIRNPDGETRQFYGNAVPLFDRHGAVRGAIGVLLDITELKKAQYKAASLAAIVESSTDAILGFTLDGIIVNWNPGAETLYGYSGEEIVGRSAALLVPPDRAEEIREIIERIRIGEVIASYDTVRMRKSGALVDVSLTVSPVKDSAGKIIGGSTIARDITERKKFETIIEQYYRELERSNRELDNFAYVAAHDLRAPLRAVTGFANLLHKHYKNTPDAIADRYISHIVDGVKRMQYLIDDLLEYARAGKSEKPLVPVYVGSVMDNVLANLRSEIDDSGAEITVGPLPTVHADSTQLVQIIQNLVANAIKYRRTKPRINIAAERKENEWLFSVSDNGIGIAPGQFDRIFEIFQRLHTKDEYSGTGIGLAICKKIVQRLGGRIWVESIPGEGATFFFTLPATE